MFPTTKPTAIITEQTASNSNGISFLFDFSIGDFILADGRLVECTGNVALKVWVEKVIRTEKERYAIYENTDYGIVLEDLIIGTVYPMEFVQSELNREIQDALLKNPEITGISSFSVERTGHLLTVTFTIETNNSESLKQEVIFGV